MDISLPGLYAATDPVLLVRLLQWVQCCNGTDPVGLIQSIAGGPYVPDPGVQFSPGSDSRTAAITVVNNYEVLVCIGGAINYNQIATLVNGITAGPDPADVTVAISTFYQAALSLKADLAARGGYVGKRVYIVGHSFGGAVAQVLGALIQLEQKASVVKVWSFGAPRPGYPQFASRLSFMNNYRFYNNGDVVPWLAPHADEVPSILVTAAVNFWRQSNQLVQAPTGYSVDGFGRITPAMGNPSSDWMLTLSITRFMANVMAFYQGRNHSVNDYLTWMRLAVQNYPSPPPRPPQQEQAPLTLRPRERDALIQIGTAEVFADATSPTGSTHSYVVPTITDPAAPRYKAARDGKVWVIKLGEEIVGSATGKRRAKSIARHWNRSARALLNVGSVAGL